MKINKIPNQIISEPLQPLNLKKVDSIALHHMATDADVKTIEKMHVQKGWRAIGYNFWVEFDGTVYEGRGFNLGAGVENQNGHIISIGFQGDYDTKKREMPNAQFNSGIDVIRYVKSKIPTIKKVGGHKDFMATACPGKYFPLAEMKKGERRETKVKYYDTVNNCPEWAKTSVKKAVEKGLVHGDEKGRLRLTDDKLWTLTVVVRAMGN